MKIKNYKQQILKALSNSYKSRRKKIFKKKIKGVKSKNINIYNFIYFNINLNWLELLN